MEKLNCKGKLVTKQEKKKEIEVMSKQMKPNTQVNKKKGASGITLIALIITSNTNNISHSNNQCSIWRWRTNTKSATG